MTIRLFDVVKPNTLYHGSPRKDIIEFEPRISLGSGEGNGPMVYATDDEAAASIFTADVRAPWSAGRFGTTWYVLIPVPRDEFLLHDVGGCIYELSSETFDVGTVGGLGEREYGSRVPVKPVARRVYDSSLDAMLAHGVQVYFIDEDIRDRIRNASDHGLAILRGLQSENQRKNRNVLPFGNQ